MGSLVEAAQALKKAGAKEIYTAVTHPVLSGPAIERIVASPIKELIATNTIPIDDSKMVDKIKVLSVGPLLASAIKRIHNGESISILFDE